MSTTYQPKGRKRARSHGFLKRRKSTAGKNVMKRRRSKGRRRITV
ncbi:MAG: 50S ribosomal protein L34 [Candidatus Taylorbacteria bacterium]|nr:50S ribosomal protein L34 [Candidatus Taylorbacteria bacterium]